MSDAVDAKKTDLVTVRLTQEVKNEVVQRATPGSLSKYVRDAVIARLKRDRKKKV